MLSCCILSLSVPVFPIRTLVRGEIVTATGRSRAAVNELQATNEWDKPLEQRHRHLRELNLLFQSNSEYSSRL